MSKSSKPNSTATAAEPFSFSLPHLHSGASLSAIHWKKTAALFPLLGICLWQSGLNALGVFAASLAGGLAGEALSETLRRKKIRISDGSAVFESLLLGLMMPSDAPFWLAALGALTGIAGREFFGGLGAYPFSPALVGRLFLQICLPLFFLDSSLMFDGGAASLLGILAGAAFLLYQRLIPWETPLLYGVVTGFGSLVFSSELVFSAFFLVTDPAGAPVSRMGRRFFAAAAGLFVIVMEKRGVPVPFAPALLMASALSPWLDRWFREGSSL